MREERRSNIRAERRPVDRVAHGRIDERRPVYCILRTRTSTPPAFFSRRTNRDVSVSPKVITYPLPAPPGGRSIFAEGDKRIPRIFYPAAAVEPRKSGHLPAGP